MNLLYCGSRSIDRLNDASGSSRRCAVSSAVVAAVGGCLLSFHNGGPRGTDIFGDGRMEGARRREMRSPPVRGAFARRMPAAAATPLLLLLLASTIIVFDSSSASPASASSSGLLDLQHASRLFNHLALVVRFQPHSSVSINSDYAPCLPTSTQRSRRRLRDGVEHRSVEHRRLQLRCRIGNQPTSWIGLGRR